MGDEIVCWSDADDLLSTISDDFLSSMSDNSISAHQTMSWDPLGGAVYETPSSNSGGATGNDMAANGHGSAGGSGKPATEPRSRKSHGGAKAAAAPPAATARAQPHGGGPVNGATWVTPERMCASPADQQRFDPWAGDSDIPRDWSVRSAAPPPAAADWPEPRASVGDMRPPGLSFGGPAANGFPANGGGCGGAGGETVVRCGWLLKKAESSWGWRRRWFILYPGRLSYQATPDGVGVVKTIPLHDGPAGAPGGAAAEALPAELEFRVHSFGRSFHLKALSPRDRAEWVGALQSVLDSLQPAAAAAAAFAVPLGGSGMGLGGLGGLRAGPGGTAAGASATALKRKLESAAPWDAALAAQHHAAAAAAASGGGGGFSRVGSAHSVGGGGGCDPRASIDSSVYCGSVASAASTATASSRGGGCGGGGGEYWDDAMSERSSSSSCSGASGGGRRAEGEPGAGGGGGGGLRSAAGEEWKRVKKGSGGVSKSLFSAGQQAVELTMRYLAHTLMPSAGPHPVHEVVFAAWQAMEGLRARGVVGGSDVRLTSQFLTSVVLRGLLVKQQMGPPDAWPEVTVNPHDAPFHRMSQHVTHLMVSCVSPHIETAPEAAVLPPILLPLLAVIELSHKHGWPRQPTEEARRGAMLSVMSALDADLAGRDGSGRHMVTSPDDAPTPPPDSPAHYRHEESMQVRGLHDLMAPPVGH